MPRQLNLRPLPEPDRREMLGEFLKVLDQHPDLAHFRAVAQTGPERQLALVAALERSVRRGSPAISPPDPQDQADLLLCDVLDCVGRHPDLKNHGAAYGPDQHLANLQALGLWRGRMPVNQPTAEELFATSFSRLTADPPTDLRSSTANNSPVPHVFGPSGELIDASVSVESTAAPPSPLPQTVEGVLIVSTAPEQITISEASETDGLIRHRAAKPGEQLGDDSPASHFVPARPVRRGRPLALDDMAKGRLLGLMSYGLSFRQAAAQLGVHHQTLLNLLKRDEAFAQQVGEARLDAISQPLLTVVQASRKNWRAAAWLAKFLDDRRVRTYETTPEERELESLKRR
jgi:hypothetical protein